PFQLAALRARDRRSLLHLDRSLGRQVRPYGHRAPAQELRSHQRRAREAPRGHALVSGAHAVAVDPARNHGRALSRLIGVGAALGVVGLGAALALGDSKQFSFSWLVAYLYFLSIALGGLHFVLVTTVTRAAWGVTLRRVAENIMATLPLFAGLFIPIWLG